MVLWKGGGGRGGEGAVGRSRRWGGGGGGGGGDDRSSQCYLGSYLEGVQRNFIAKHIDDLLLRHGSVGTEGGHYVGHFIFVILIDQLHQLACTGVRE